MTNDERGLLTAIWADPHDDAPRLVYADFLQENGDPDRAEFIRLQIELAKRDRWDDDPQTQAMRQRDYDLWRRHQKEWKGGVPREEFPRAVRGFAFPSQSFGGRAFARLAPNALDAAPLWRVRLLNVVRSFDAALAAPALERVGELTVELHHYRHDALRKMADCPRLRNVAELDLAGGYPSVEGVAAFLHSPASASLSRLTLSAMPPPAFPALVSSPVAKRLTHFKTYYPACPTDGPTFTAARFPRLRVLELTRTIPFYPPADAVVTALVSADPPPLRELDLRGCPITRAGAERLAAWPGLAGLKALTVGDNQFGPRGYAALASSPYLGGLREFRVPEVELIAPRFPRKAISERFGDAIRFL